MNKIPIVDVSRHQGTMDWQRTAAAGITRAAIRCTVGDYYADPSFATNWQGAKAAGLLVTAYHAVAPETNYNAQFEWFLSALGSRECDWQPVLDCELTRSQSKATITSCIQHLASLVEAADGRAPIIYTRKTWWDVNVLPWSGWKRHPLWAARYANLTGPWSDGPKYKFRDWDDWACWQFSADGNGRGAEFGASSDSIDLNLLRPDMLGEEVPPPGLTLEQRVANLEVWARMNGAILP